MTSGRDVTENGRAADSPPRDPPGGASRPDIPASTTKAASEPDIGSAAKAVRDAAKLFASQIGILLSAALRRVSARAAHFAGSAADHPVIQKAARAAARARTHPVLSQLRDQSVRLGAAVSRSAAAHSMRASRIGGRRLVRLAIAAAVVMLVLGIGTILYAVATLPVDGGQEPEATQAALTIESDQGETFATRGVFKGEELTAKTLPPHLKKAIIAIEDRRFYQHWGVDLRGTLRAAWRNTQANATREGGSTITQQLARLMYLSQERSFRRKLQEALIAVWLEWQLDKDEILIRYLNTAYFGAGAYGADAAAKRYFGKSAKELSLAEAAMLAGLVRAPSQLAPTRNFGGANERAQLVLAAMVETGAITAEQAEATRAQTATLRTPPETPPGANYFVDLVTSDVRRLLGSASGDATLRTTLNLDLQRLAEGVIERRLESDGAKKNATQAALIAMRPDGAIVALVGGRDYEESQFNRATQARRQAGSLFKLFVYLSAFRKGYTPQSVLVDEPVQIGDWEPQNANGRFRGPVTLKAAFAQSINSVAVQLAQDVSVPAVIDVARQMGVQADLPAVPSLALGSAEVTLLDMTRAYAAIAAGVESLEPYVIRSINSGAHTFYTHPATGPDAKGQLGATRAMMIDLLQAVVTEGTGRAARLPNVAVAGKTGTTQDYRDAWFVGFTPDLVIGVWVGNDDNSAMKKVVGGDLPAEIWHDFAARAAPVLAQRGPRPGARTAGQPSAKTAIGEVAPPAAGAAAAKAAMALRGTPRVIDTGTLEIDGQTVRLYGVVGETGRAARQLQRFLRREKIDCAAAVANVETYQCRIGDEDLAALILGGGGARAAEDASPELLAAEEQARSMRVGIWRRRR